jgi:hypothetical protein
MENGEWGGGSDGGIDKVGDKVGRQSEGTLTPALSHRMGEGEVTGKWFVVNTGL